MAVHMPIRQSFHDLVRLRHMAQILIRNGLGFVIEQLGLTRLLAPLYRGKLEIEAAEAERLSMPERVRRTLEDLGPTYVKLGQLMSTRPDIFPPEYISEFSKLLDAVPPFPVEVARRQIEKELGRPLSELFAHFDPLPVASASIGQVHRAILPSGERVVVKVQRPDIRQTIESDLDLLLRQARFLERHSALLRDYQLSEIVEEFGQGLRDELDYMREGRNAERLRQVLRHNGRIHIPKIYWELTTRQVITMEDVSGTKLTELEVLQERGADLPDIARTIADIYLHQVFVAGVFHADPHPANIIVRDEGLSLVDFGLVGFLSDTLKENLRDLLVALMAQDVEQIADGVFRLGAVSTSVNRQALERDIQRLLHRYYGVSLASVPLADWLRDITQVAFRQRIRLPADLALLARTLLILEGLTLKLDPSFNFVEFASPFLARMLRERLSLRRWGEETLRTWRSLNRLAGSLPRRADMLLEQFEQGEATLGVEIRRLDRVMRRLDTIANRLAFSIIIAALVVGSSLIMRMEGDTTWHIPILGWAMPVARVIFVIAGVLGLWLLLSIVRSRGL